MKKLKVFYAAAVFYLISGFGSCKPSSEPKTDFDPNGCNEYACPVHQDKVFISQQKCKECGLQMIDKNSIDSLQNRIKRVSIDSLKLFHKLIIEQSDIIMKNDSMSKEELILYLIDITKNLNRAKIVNQNLDSLFFGKQMVLLNPNSKKLVDLYAAATYRITSISNELAKENYDKLKIRFRTNELREIIYEIDQNIIEK